MPYYTPKRKKPYLTQMEKFTKAIDKKIKATKQKMPKYTVYSKSKTSKNWLVERSYMNEKYALEVAKTMRKNGRQAKVIKE